MSLFGNSSSGGQSNNNATTSNPPPSGSLFGSSTTPTTSASTNLFGSSTAATPAFSFGNLGGGNNSAAPGSSGPAPSPFGNTATKPGEQKPLFGQTTGAGTLGSTPTSGAGGPGLFSSSSQTPPSNPNLFGSAAKPAQSTSLFGNPASTTPTSTGTAPSATMMAGSSSTPTSPPGSTSASEPAKTQTTSLFTSLGKPASGTGTTEQTKPTSSLFGNTASTPATGAANATPAPGATASATPASTATTTAAPASSLFGTAPKAATSSDNTAPQSAAGANNALGASTAGPTSSMARLKNKTMDEIITRWATDLSKYQKEFKEQAAQVAQWDRLLVENGERIQKLYLETFEAEKGSREIERQLVGIESQQEELESWLDRYEGEVDSIFSKQIGHGDQLAGPDQEREKTYKLAEKITEKLDDMGRDLTKMIKEINDISGTLSKGNKPDDPLSQIVRVLNSHLAQLQWIDTNAAALQAKVAAAQKERSTIGNHYGGPEQDNVDSFYRSYMGRR
ncbi:Nsp1-like C-terminal region-domain-containing protein [Daldinia grandis]|nr:Nsp1-like C-terminal region-domain-containing protein [Daldinia grandis]